MQDRTINNALLTLYRAGGEQAELVKTLLALRGVPLPKKMRGRTLARGKSRRLVLSLLPCTTSEAIDGVQAALPGVSRRSANQRAYMALRRLEAAGVVRCDGGIWSKHKGA